MDVLLFNPAPRQGFQAHRRVELPLSVLYPATPLDRLGYKVEIVDQFADPEWEAKFRQALETRPICMGVTSMTGPQILRAIEASAEMKRRHPDVPVVWGGIHASLMPHQTLKNPNIDIVVVGEGELAGVVGEDVGVGVARQELPCEPRFSGSSRIEDEHLDELDVAVRIAEGLGESP